MNNIFLYHHVPENMTGKILYPLNTLKEMYPDIYREHVEKYENRQHLLTRVIPTLNCLWNDVLHLTAVTPEELHNNLLKAGIAEQKIKWRRWFKIELSKLDLRKVTVYLYKHNSRNGPSAEDFCDIDLNKISDYRTVPQETIRYYQEQNKLDQRPLLFHGIPHILYKGTINIENVEIIEM